MKSPETPHSEPTEVDDSEITLDDQPPIPGDETEIATDDEFERAQAADASLKDRIIQLQDQLQAIDEIIAYQADPDANYNYRIANIDTLITDANTEYLKWLDAKATDPDGDEIYAGYADVAQATLTELRTVKSLTENPEQHREELSKEFQESLDKYYNNQVFDNVNTKAVRERSVQIVKRIPIADVKNALSSIAELPETDSIELTNSIIRIASPLLIEALEIQSADITFQTQSDGEHAERCGSCTMLEPGKFIININPENQENIVEHLSTLAHELLHVRQRLLGLNSPDNELAKLYRYNDTYYAYPNVDYTKYRKQLKEVEAFDFETVFRNLILKIASEMQASGEI